MHCKLVSWPNKRFISIDTDAVEKALKADALLALTLTLTLALIF